MNRTIDEPPEPEPKEAASEGCVTIGVVKASAALRPASPLSRAIRARLLQRMMTDCAEQSRDIAVAVNVPREVCDGRAMDPTHACAGRDERSARQEPLLLPFRFRASVLTFYFYQTYVRGTPTLLKPLNTFQEAKARPSNEEKSGIIANPNEFGRGVRAVWQFKCTVELCAEFKKVFEHFCDCSRSAGIAIGFPFRLPPYVLSTIITN